MPTVEEVLKASGMTDEQITALDAKVKTGFTQVLSTATQTLEQAEAAKRAQAADYDEKIAPALDKWANDSATLTAERDYYKTLAEKAKEGGFVPGAAPFTPPNPAAQPVRSSDGKFVSNVPGTVPGSPTYMTKEEGFRAVTSAQWFVSEYMRLHNGAAPPEDMESLAIEAQAQHIPFRDYVAKKFDFAGKREAIKASEQKKHDDAIRTEEREKTTKEITERLSSNPHVRQAEVSKFSEIRAGIKDGKRPDPLKMTREQRHTATGNAIRSEMAQNETVQ